MSFDKKLESILTKHKDMGDKLSDPGQLGSKEFAKLSKEYSDLGELVEKINQYNEARKSFSELEEMMKDASSDKEMQNLAEAEMHEFKKKLPVLEKEIQVLLLPKDAADEKNAILEVRAGTGGDEAALFAADLFNMYQRYAENRGWKFEVLYITETGIGGFKEASATITGKNVFERMKFESGVHRVQRVPKTETQGRVHTSAATVAVLPEAEEVDVKVDLKDIRVDIFRSSGPGGQSVNTTDSAVRMTHVPTGIVVSMQDEKSQHKNREKAMKVLLSRLYDKQRQELDDARAADRKSQIGSGDRSERIRTYNFPQSRVTDHRINLTAHNIDNVVYRGELDELIDALISEDQATKLAEATA